MVDEDLLELVLDKPELRGMHKGFARRILTDWLDSHPGVLAAYEEDPDRFTRKKEFQQLRSEVRSTLRDLYGVFFTPRYASKREKLVDALIQEPSQQRADAVLSLHRSTKERLQHYTFLYHQLFRFAETPESVLDLGCGFNPFSYPYLPNAPAYYSADIACEDLGLVERFFESVGIEHAERCVDLSSPEAVEGLPRADVAFAFKLFDSLEQVNRDVTAALLDVIPADTLIASFATMSIGQGSAIGPREWFEDLVTEKVLGRVTLPNEQFLIITLR